MADQTEPQLKPTNKIINLTDSDQIHPDVDAALKNLPISKLVTGDPNLPPWERRDPNALAKIQKEEQPTSS
jgi:hypothetical protein